MSDLSAKVWDAAGNLWQDLTTRYARKLGQVTITSSNQSGSVTDAGFADGDPWYFMLGATQVYGEPRVSFSGNTMTWTATGLGTFSGTLFYGVR